MHILCYPLNKYLRIPIMIKKCFINICFMLCIPVMLQETERFNCYRAVAGLDSMPLNSNLERVNAVFYKNLNSATDNYNKILLNMGKKDGVVDNFARIFIEMAQEEIPNCDIEQYNYTMIAEVLPRIIFKEMMLALRAGGLKFNMGSLLLLSMILHSIGKRVFLNCPISFKYEKKNLEYFFAKSFFLNFNEDNFNMLDNNFKQDFLYHTPLGDTKGFALTNLSACMKVLGRLPDILQPQGIKQDMLWGTPFSSNGTIEEVYDVMYITTDGKKFVGEAKNKISNLKSKDYLKSLLKYGFTPENLSNLDYRFLIINMDNIHLVMCRSYSCDEFNFNADNNSQKYKLLRDENDMILQNAIQNITNNTLIIGAKHMASTVILYGDDKFFNHSAGEALFERAMLSAPCLLDVAEEEGGGLTFYKSIKYNKFKKCYLIMEFTYEQIQKVKNIIAQNMQQGLQNLINKLADFFKEQKISCKQFTSELLVKNGLRNIENLTKELLCMVA